MIKELETLARLARDQGWSVTEAKGKVEWRPNNGYPLLTTSNQPHATRTLANIKADLHKRGLMEAEELRHERRRQDKIQKLLNGELSPKGLKEVVYSRQDLLTDPEWNWQMFTEKDWVDFSRLLATKIVNYNGGKWEAGAGLKVFRELEPTCGRCGREFAHMFGWFKHEQKCEKSRGEGMTTEILDEEPEDRRALIHCPEPQCIESFFKSQTYERAEHMRIEHDIAECPACLRVMRVNSLDTHLEKHCPVQNRGRVAPIKRGKNREEPTVAAQPVQGPPAAPPIPANFVAQPAPTAVAAELATDDDTLWSLLEMVLDGPVVLNRHTLTQVNQWMEATRALRELVMEQRK